MDNIDEQIDTVTRSVLALLQVTRWCRNHKFVDPGDRLYALAKASSTAPKCCRVRSRHGTAAASTTTTRGRSVRRKEGNVPEKTKRLRAEEAELARPRRPEAIRSKPEARRPPTASKVAGGPAEDVRLKKRVAVMLDPASNGQGSSVRDAKAVLLTRNCASAYQVIAQHIPRVPLLISMCRTCGEDRSRASSRLEPGAVYSQRQEPAHHTVMVNASGSTCSARSWSVAWTTSASPATCRRTPNCSITSRAGSSATAGLRALNADHGPQPRPPANSVPKAPPLLAIDPPAARCGGLAIAARPRRFATPCAQPGSISSAAPFTGGISVAEVPFNGPKAGKHGRRPASRTGRLFAAVMRLVGQRSLRLRRQGW